MTDGVSNIEIYKDKLAEKETITKRLETIQQDLNHYFIEGVKSIYKDPSRIEYIKIKTDNEYDDENYFEVVTDLVPNKKSGYLGLREELYKLSWGEKTNITLKGFSDFIHNYMGWNEYGENETISDTEISDFFHEIVY